MKTFKQVQAVVVSFAMVITFVTPTSVIPNARAADLQSQQPLQTTPRPTSSAPTPKELQQLVAPIALYPDKLVAQVLAGATNPTDVVEADRWLQENKNLKGSQLMAAVDKQPWDPSVKALTEFPSVLHNMSVNLSWTSGLGDAYFNDPQGVMAAIQALRKDAENAGNLKTTPQQTVSAEGQTIVIQPTNPEVVYVPTYSPAVYGTPIAAYPGYSGWDVAAASALSFGVGAAVGAAFNYGWGWGGWGADWHGGSATFNRNNYVSRSNTFVNRNTRYNQALSRTGQANRANINRGMANRSAGQFNRPNYNAAINQANRMKPQSLSASRGFGNRDFSSVGARSGAFSGFDRGGAAGLSSARGRSSFSGGGFRGGGGGFRGGGGGFRGGGGGFRGGGGRGGGRR